MSYMHLMGSLGCFNQYRGIAFLVVTFVDCFLWELDSQEPSSGLKILVGNSSGIGL